MEIAVGYTVVSHNGNENFELLCFYCFYEFFHCRLRIFRR